jgi:murein DD-endopeptidase MepM/ murein hydrolase activator NlpD
MVSVAVLSLLPSSTFAEQRTRRRTGLAGLIFAPRWTEVLAATSGTLSSIGNGGRAGRSLWLAGADGRSYFYGHLEAWVRGIHEGMEVAPGQVVG